MRRSKAHPPICCSAVFDYRTAPIKLLLRTGKNIAIRVDAHETSRRNVYSQTFLRIQEYLGKFEEGRSQDKQETSARNDADYGISWKSTWSKYVEEQTGAHQVSISLEKSSNHHALTSVEHRYYLH